ncbi:divalent metal cation transporter, partial [Blastomonas sp. CCH1-A6]|uniref:divalent metal cation transporter n=1 Tax=Blastomonas sp. CCH1-A6 TaxID=1768762 RepID=UPI000AB6E9B5
ANLPRLPADSLFTAIALIGTTVVPYNLFLHAASVRGKFAPDAEGLAASNLDTGLSVTLGGLLSMAIVIMGAATAKLTASGAGPLDDIALRLESLFGMPARIVFALGLVGAGFSSALTAPLATGYVLAEMTGGANDPVRRTRIFRRTALVVIAIGTVFAFFAVNPIELILIAQSANGLLLPILAAFLLWVAARRQSLGAFANGPIANLLGGAVVLVCAGLGARLILRSAGIWP